MIKVSIEIEIKVLEKAKVEALAQKAIKVSKKPNKKD